MQSALDFVFVWQGFLIEHTLSLEQLAHMLVKRKPDFEQLVLDQTRLVECISNLVMAFELELSGQQPTEQEVPILEQLLR